MACRVPARTGGVGATALPRAHSIPQRHKSTAKARRAVPKAKVANAKVAKAHKARPQSQAQKPAAYTGYPVYTTTPRSGLNKKVNDQLGNTFFPN